MENKKIIIFLSSIIIILLGFTVFTYINMRQLKEVVELQQNEVAEVTNESEEVAKEKPSNEENSVSREEKLKNAIIKNINNKTEKDMKVLDKLKGTGKPVGSLDEATGNVTSYLMGGFGAMLVGLERISGYTSLLLLIVGALGYTMTSNAPMLRKTCIGFMIVAPIFYVLVNFGPAFLYGL